MVQLPLHLLPKDVQTHLKVFVWKYRTLTDSSRPGPIPDLELWKEKDGFYSTEFRDPWYIRFTLVPRRGGTYLVDATETKAPYKSRKLGYDLNGDLELQTPDYATKKINVGHEFASVEEALGALQRWSAGGGSATPAAPTVTAEEVKEAEVLEGLERLGAYDYTHVQMAAPTGEYFHSGNERWLKGAYRPIHGRPPAALWKKLIEVEVDKLQKAGNGFKGYAVLYGVYPGGVDQIAAWSAARGVEYPDWMIEHETTATPTRSEVKRILRGESEAALTIPPARAADALRGIGVHPDNARYAVPAAEAAKAKVTEEVQHAAQGKPPHEIGYAIEQRLLGHVPWSPSDPQGRLARDAWYAVGQAALTRAGRAPVADVAVAQALKDLAPLGPAGPATQRRREIGERLKQLRQQALERAGSNRLAQAAAESFADDAEVDRMVKGHRSLEDLEDLLTAAEEQLVELPAAPPKRLYHVIIRNDRKGEDTYLSLRPMIHREATTFLSKTMPDSHKTPWIRTMLIEVDPTEEFVDSPREPVPTPKSTIDDDFLIQREMSQLRSALQRDPPSKYEDIELEEALLQLYQKEEEYAREYASVFPRLYPELLSLLNKRKAELQEERRKRPAVVTPDVAYIVDRLSGWDPKHGVKDAEQLKRYAGYLSRAIKRGGAAADVKKAQAILDALHAEARKAGIQGLPEEAPAAPEEEPEFPSRALREAIKQLPTLNKWEEKAPGGTLQMDRDYFRFRIIRLPNGTARMEVSQRVAPYGLFILDLDTDGYPFVVPPQHAVRPQTGFDFESPEVALKAIRSWAGRGTFRIETAPIVVPSEPPRPERDPNVKADVEISWSPQEGLLVHTRSRAYNDILKQFHLKWSRFNEAWYFVGSKGQNRPPPSVGLERLRDALEAAGAVVDLEEADPVSDQELARIRLEKAERHAECADERAAKAGAEAAQHWERGHLIGERFAMGQPILVGHHSEGKARRDQQRIHAASCKAVDAMDKQDYYASKAAGLEQVATVQSRIASGQAQSDLERVTAIGEALKALKPKKNLGLEQASIPAPKTARGSASIWSQFARDGQRLTIQIYPQGATISGTQLQTMEAVKYDGTSTDEAAQLIYNRIDPCLTRLVAASLNAAKREQEDSVEEALKHADQERNYLNFTWTPKRHLTEVDQYIMARREHFRDLLNAGYSEVARRAGSWSEVRDALKRELYRLAREEMS